MAEGRVIHTLRQLCGSLAEAHGVGLIHRDVKPANVILSCRGGMPDVVKLLDFGLVKAVNAASHAAITTSGALTGTPLYISPEAIEEPQKVDAPSDLCAVGAIGYFLLTGAPVFEGRSVVDICAHHVGTEPEPPSQRLGRAVAADLESIILRCLAKKPADRPPSAVALEEEFASCSAAGAWTRADAQAWWQRHFPDKLLSTADTSTSGDKIAETIVQDSR